MKKLIFCLAVLGAVLSGCSTDDNENGGGNGGSQTPQLPELPPLPDPNDVCSCMDDIVFMQYCYDNFDVNHDGAVSPTEAAAVPEMILCEIVNGYTYNGLPVKSLTGIGYFSNLELLDCRNCSQLQSVDLRRNRKLKLPKLGDNEGLNGCFSSCSALSEIFLPDNISSIGSCTFTGCSSLTSITIPDSVTEIGGAAFSGCSSLTSITIPDSVTTIGRSTFGNCSSLTNVTIGNSVTTIGNYAFLFCHSLTSITIPDSVTTIGEDAFQYCSGLTNVTIGDNVTEIGGSAFYGCTNLSRFYGKYATSDNRCLVLDGKLVGFAPCDLVSYTIPNNVTTIGDSAFSGCSGLTTITIPDSVTTIGDYAFFGCSGLTTITIPDSVTTIGDYAFSGCSGLTRINIPNGVTEIGNSAFKGCTGECFIDQNIPDVSNGDSSWFYDSKFSKIIIGNNVTIIGCHAFYACHSLTSITIPDSVTTIGVAAFGSCSSLTSITIPDVVWSIGYDAFYGCSGLKSFYCKPQTPPYMAQYSSVNHYHGYNIGLNEDVVIYVPAESVDAYKTDEYWGWGRYYASQIQGYDF